MAKIPEQVERTPEEMYEKLQTWWQQQQQLKVLKVAEVLARKDMTSYFFITPREGTNRLDLGGGWDLKLDNVIARNVDEAALDSAKPADFKRLKLDKDALFDWKPVLNIKAYRKLNDEQRAFIDELLDVKDNTPQLHIVQRAVEDNVGVPATPVASIKPPRAPRKTAAAKAAPKPPAAAKAPKPPAKKVAAKKVAPKPPRGRK